MAQFSAKIVPPTPSLDTPRFTYGTPPGSQQSWAARHAWDHLVAEVGAVEDHRDDELVHPLRLVLQALHQGRQGDDEASVGKMYQLFNEYSDSQGSDGQGKYSVARHWALTETSKFAANCSNWVC